MIHNRADPGVANTTLSTAVRALYPLPLPRHLYRLREYSHCAGSLESNGFVWIFGSLIALAVPANNI